MEDEKTVNMITEFTRLSPSSPSPSHFSLPLTFFDTLWFKFPPTERVFLYQLADLTRESFYSDILPRLKRSLSAALVHYFPLAGNIKWDASDPTPTITCAPNDAVSLTVAESTADFSNVCADEVHEVTVLHSLLPELPVGDHLSLIISLQITLFPGRGFSLGFSTHHAVLDGHTIASFIKAWAYMNKHDQENASLPADLIPSFDRSAIKDPAGLNAEFLNMWIAFGGGDSDPSKRNLKTMPLEKIDPKFVRATFGLSREDIKKLRERVLVQNDHVKRPLHLSTFVITYAYVFTCMVKARGGDNDRLICSAFTADYRTRLDPPVPSNYFGNCVILQMGLGYARDLMGKDGFVTAAKNLSDLVSGLDIDAPKRVPDLLSKIMSLRQEMQLGSVAGSTRFGTYGIDFGWGKPKKVEIASIDGTGAFSLMESRDGNGGVEIGVSMRTREEMENFASLFSTEQ
ncbi:malonyl-CoA:anthocyanidin 5-O-glucoside-6''-O-malonyltransferase-like [Carica papaya]|uniref:malonyl-CoA:anthocyanidin 5-O-glucoside-6''-O-malonyltransferase-like n=1 Tax=Carica papaya TaxID=3649 RepID=UPI000B8C7B9E|nr:malonyl-CoA:anthocyanidin 5-O-glucoside-6''-O-malonyltransferase-like [Carica papaya]